MQKLNIKKYISDGLLIVFSVLFALFINKIAERMDMQTRKETALTSIRSELYRNSGVIAMWNEKHGAIQNRLDSLITGKNDSLMKVMLQNDYLDLGILTNQQSLIEAVLSDTAWESAKAAGIVSQFDFDTTQKLTNVYKMQTVLMDDTVRSILDLYFSRESHKMDDMDATLFQFHLRFHELVGQEILMKQLYDEAITAID
ncbi:MAG: hypothetical protein ABJN95_17990 [Maribacter sp.]|uniref:hypothetical protein n=1 Tax=Maribacter sp. TaxID=1897614 RepID=UPI003297A51C